MEQFEWNGCYLRLEERRLTVGNSLIEQAFYLHAGQLLTEYLLDKEAGKRWDHPSGTLFCAQEPFLNYSAARMTLSAGKKEDGIRPPHFEAVVSFACGERRLDQVFEIYVGEPFLTFYQRLYAPDGCTLPVRAEKVRQDPTGIEGETQESTQVIGLEGDFIAVLPLSREHLKLHAAAFQDKTDVHDALVLEQEEPYYPRSSYAKVGNWFVLDDYLQGRVLILVKEGPTHLSALHHTFDFYGDRRGCVALCGAGTAGETFCGEVCRYGGTIGVAASGSERRAFRRYYRHSCAAGLGRPAFSMSNTWGDRNQDAAVCERFVLEELERAARLGLDIVQIDDGWQLGITANSLRAPGGVWEGYYANNPRFWEVNPERFPNGLAPICERARQLGVRLGLWFSPDSSSDFVNWRRDADTLLHLYEAYGIACFKLDGVKLRTLQGTERYLSLLREAASRSGGAILFNQDVTAEDRPGYLFHREFGTQFVENRYTDWKNYYPHRTLRNLWRLAHYFPACKFQFELLNVRRNRELYAGDPLAPEVYPADYLLASVLFSNPLFWMELQSLDEGQMDSLSNLLNVWKEHREAFGSADVQPVGGEPDGTQLCGFHALCPDGREYLLCLREPLCADNAACYPAYREGAGWKVLSASEGAHIRETEDGCAAVVLPRPCNYLLAVHG
ncbi:MAG: hypothetical protein HFG26_10500 [Provencibacterium sp.]|jgi:alpha-galactosidase|nr:hypothetical protein [Provencibacterium sp.]